MKDNIKEHNHDMQHNHSWEHKHSTGNYEHNLFENKKVGDK